MDSKLLINVAISPFGLEKTIKFKSVDDAIQWISTEITAWEPFWKTMNPPNQSVNGAFHIAAKHRRVIDRAFQLFYDLRENENSGYETEEAKYLDAIRALESPPYLASGSLAGKHIIENFSDDRVNGIFALAFFLGEDVSEKFNFDSINLLKIMRSISFYRNGDVFLSEEVARRRKEMAKNSRNWARDIDELKKRNENIFESIFNKMASEADKASKINSELSDFYISSKSSLESIQSERGDSLTKLEEHHAKKFSELYDNASHNLDKIQVTYQEHMRLKAPAIFWTDKARRHRKSSRIWLFVTSLLLISGIGAGGWGYYLILNWLATLEQATIATATLVLLALPALLYVTLVRMSHRSYRDELRHGDDAEQRATLVQTYLALTHEDSAGIQPGERLLALHALFRGSAKSDSPDDTPQLMRLRRYFRV